MNDTERLQEWMNQRNTNLKQVSREMGIPYATAYHAVVERPSKQDNDHITGNFVVRFIATYGIENASGIFAELAPRELAEEVA